MAVTAVKIDGNFYFKIDRTIGGNAIQKYVRIPTGEKASKLARIKADRIDSDLANRQAVMRMKKKMDVTQYIREDKKIKGMTRVQRKRRNRPHPVDEFVVQVWDKRIKKARRAGFSVYAHGFDAAFEQALAAWINFKAFEPNGFIHEQLRACKEAYNGEQATDDVEENTLAERTIVSSDTDDFEESIRREISYFVDNRDQRAISGRRM